MRASPAGTEGPFVLWRQNITSMFLRTDSKNRDSRRDWDFIRAPFGPVLVSPINRWLKQSAGKSKLYTKYHFSFSCQDCSITGNKNKKAEICASLCSRQAVGGVCVCVLEAGGSVNHPRAPVCCPWTAGTQLMTAGLVRINIHHDYLLHLLALVPSV